MTMLKKKKKYMQEEYNRNVDRKIQTVVCLQVTDVCGAWGRGSTNSYDCVWRLPPFLVS